MRRLCLAAVLLVSAVTAACTGGGGTDGQGSSTTADAATAEAAMSDAASDYFAAVGANDFERANELRCPSERVEADGLAQFEAASEELLAGLGGVEVSATDGAIGADRQGIATVTLAPSGAEVALRLEEDDRGAWRVCGQLTPEADDARSMLNQQGQEALGAEVAIDDVFPGFDIDGYELARSDVPPSEPDDVDRGVVRRDSRLFSGPVGAPDIRVVVTEFGDAEEAVFEELRQGGDLIDNSVAVLDVDGPHDRGVRYLASFKTFIQPSTLGPYWDAVWLLVDNYLVLVSVGPIALTDEPSVAEEVARGILDQVAVI